MGENLIQLCLSGVVMGVLLTQRGKLVLHASSVQMNGSAVAFLGDSGWGKSSIAAALVSRGHKLISDDVTCVNIETEPVSLYPGVPQLKISPEVATVLGIDRRSLHQLCAGEEKLGLRVPSTVSAEPIFLRRIYVLAQARDFGIERFHNALALFSLLYHAYPNVLPRDRDPKNFIQCGQLLKQVSVYQLKRTLDLETLPRIAEMIERDIRVGVPTETE